MTPDPSFFFPSQKHTEALSSLIYAVTEKRGFVVVTGEIGSGKTTVCRTLLQKLDPAAKIALITNTNLTAKQLLEAVCRDFGLQTEKQTKVGLLSNLNRFLVEQNEAGNAVVLILDEAQDLSVKALEEIRLISNIETDTQKLMQIMLLGQPELRDKLTMPELEQLRQRVSLRYHLRGLDREETGRYIEHRLRVAGDEGRVRFTKGAVDSLYEFSRGVPRLINVVCDQALLLGYLRETRKLDEAIVREIAAEFSYAGEEQNEGPRNGESRGRWLGFWKVFGRKRSSPRSRPEESPLRSPLGEMERAAQNDEEVSLQDEEEVLRRISGLKLAGIYAENGAFVAAIDGVKLKAGESLFGIRVAGIEEDRIVFRAGAKRYQLAIESQGNVEGSPPAMRELAAEANPEGGTLDNEV